MVHLLQIDETTLIYYNPPKSIAYIGVHYWCCTFYGFGQMYNDIPHDGTIQSIFTLLKILYAGLLIPLAPRPKLVQPLIF